MSKRFTIVTLVLTAVVAFLIGAIVAGGGGHSDVSAGPPAKASAAGRSISHNNSPAALNVLLGPTSS